MPRSENQKLKLLYLKQFFEEKTDENHTATTPEMIAYLHAHEVEAERKSIYSDLRALKAFGMVLRKEDDEDKERVKEFTYSNRPFELREVKLIIDSVASSKFLSEKKSDELIKKLGKLVSEHQRRELRRQVRVMGRAKSMNDSALNIIDHIHGAMAADRMIKFKYFHYNLKKEREYTHKGQFYEVSPWALLYDNDYYYLYAFVDDGFKTFRVDRMSGVTVLETKRQGKEAFDSKDMIAFSKSTFNMFSGKEERVEMVFHNRMIDVVIDKFGKDVWLTKVDDWHFKIAVPVAVSPQFFAWVFGLGNYVTITGPEHVKQQMKKMLEDVHSRY